MGVIRSRLDREPGKPAYGEGVWVQVFGGCRR